MTLRHALALTVLLTCVGWTTAAHASSIAVCNESQCTNQRTPWSFSNYAATRYPIVLAHGMAAFSRIGPIDSWYQIPQDLARYGANVYITQVASFESSEVRGEQLLAQVEEILAITGASKVNLIGHSHGGQSVRYVAGVAPHLVASVTAISSPHQGSPVADLVESVVESPLGDALADPVVSVINGFFRLVGLLSGQAYEQDALAGMVSLTTAGAAAFNQRFPAGLPPANNPCGSGAPTHDGIRLYSWNGTSPLTNVLDPSDYALSLTALAFKGAPNDGLVGRCSSRFGQVIRDNYRMNHLDTVNHLFGLSSLFETSPRALYRQHANRLKNAGL